MTSQKRFWNKVNKDGPIVSSALGKCWIWTANTHPITGYGYVTINNKSRTVHKVSYEWNIGIIPRGMQVQHKCDVRNCVNPTHLKLGTPAENNKDCVDRKRNAVFFGEEHGRHKLTQQMVNEIHDLLTHGDLMQKEIGKRYGVGQDVISRIKNGRAWTYQLYSRQR